MGQVKKHHSLCRHSRLLHQTFCQLRRISTVGATSHPYKGEKKVLQAQLDHARQGYPSLEHLQGLMWWFFLIFHFQVSGIKGHTSPIRPRILPHRARVHLSITNKEVWWPRLRANILLQTQRLIWYYGATQKLPEPWGSFFQHFVSSPRGPSIGTHMKATGFLQ